MEGGDSGRGELPRRCLLPVDEALCSHRRVGHVVTSTNPIGGSSAWKVADADSNIPLNGVSCASTTLCVGVDGGGNAVTSTNPTDGASAWKVTEVDGANGFDTVSCPSTTLCVTVDAEGNLVVVAVLTEQADSEPFGLGSVLIRAVLQGARLGLLYQAAPGGGDSPGRDPNGARCARRRFAAERPVRRNRREGPARKCVRSPPPLQSRPTGERDNMYCVAIRFRRRRGQA